MGQSSATHNTRSPPTNSGCAGRWGRPAARAPARFHAHMPRAISRMNSQTPGYARHCQVEAAPVAEHQKLTWRWDVGCGRKPSLLHCSAQSEKLFEVRVRHDRSADFDGADARQGEVELHRVAGNELPPQL